MIHFEGDISLYFLRAEFACKCGCGFDTADAELVFVLDEIRSHFNAPVIITSGCRCVKHNKAVGGAVNSYHLRGQAADIQVFGIRPDTVFEYLTNKYNDQYGIGLYTSWCHIDIRPKRSRW